MTLGGSSTIAALAPRAAVDLQQAIASRNQFARAMESFVVAINAIQEEGKTYDEFEQDERSRSVHAPIFRRLLVQFDQIALPENDPAQPPLQDTRRTIVLMLELLEMPSVIAAESGKPQPADPARVAIIESELKTISERIQTFANRQQAKQQQR